MRLAEGTEGGREGGMAQGEGEMALGEEGMVKEDGRSEERDLLWIWLRCYK